MRLKIGLNEGSLLRRTILHVLTFVVGSVLFVGGASFTLVSIVKAVAKPADGALATSDGTNDARSDSAALGGKTKPALKTSSRTKGPEPRKDE